MNGLFKDAFAILFARGFIRLAQLLSFVLLARFLTPEEFGWFGIVTTAMALAATLGSLGLRQSVAYQIGRRQMELGEGTATILVAWPFLSVISAAVVFFFYGHGLPNLSPGAAGVAILAGVAGTMLIMMLQGIYLGRGDIRAFNISETLPRVLLTVFALLLAITSLTNVVTSIWAYALSFLVIVPLAVKLAVSDGVGHLRVRLDRIRGLISYGVVFAVNIFLIVFCSRLSMFIIESYHDVAAAGKFFAAARVNDIILEAATAFGFVVFSRSVQNTEVKRVVDKTARISCWMFWSFSLGAAGVALFAPMILKLLLGDGYADAGGALMILAMGLGAASANKVIYPSIAGQGRPLFGSPVILLSLLANLLAALWFVPQWGVNGGAAALVLGQYVMFFGYIIACRLTFGVPIRQFLIPRRQDICGVARKISKLVNKK